MGSCQFHFQTPYPEKVLSMEVGYRNMNFNLANPLSHSTVLLLITKLYQLNGSQSKPKGGCGRGCKELMRECARNRTLAIHSAASNTTTLRWLIHTYQYSRFQTRKTDNSRDKLPCALQKCNLYDTCVQQVV
jgi:hypothetical protein